MNRGLSKVAGKPGSIAWLVLLVIMGIGAWARWRYMQAEVFQIDEFISMLAIRMILEKGQPVLPSGLFYDHGLVFSYMGAIVARLAGGELLAARWWSLIAGVLSIGVCYVLTWRLYESHGWGLIAALGLALHDNAIQWGGRVRMYSQANLMLLLWILLIWLGTMGGKHRWARLAFIFTLWLGVKTHLVLLLTLPPLVIALAAVWIIHKHGKNPWQDIPRAILIEATIACLAIVIIVWSAQTSFVASYTVDSSVPDSTAAAVNTNPGADILAIELNRERWSGMGHYLLGDLRPITVLALVGGLAALVSVSRRRCSRVDLAALFVTLVLAGLLLEILFLVADKWHQDRYRFLVILPFLLLLAAYGLRAVVHGVVWTTRRLVPGKKRVSTVSAIAAIILFVVWPMLGPWKGALRASTWATDTPNRYHRAFEYVDSVRGLEDELLAIQSAAGYIFSKQLDYYVNHTTPVIIPGQNGWVDGYAGVPYLGNITELDQALDKPGRLWFVVDKDRLYSKLKPIFTLHLLSRMEVVHEIDNVLILRELEVFEKVRPLVPAQQASTFINNIELVGYAIDKPLLKGQQAGLTTFWKNTRFVPGYKVFVHLREQAGRTVAQADFAPLAQIDPKLHDRLVAQEEDDMVQLHSTLLVPSDVLEGKYKLYIGIYNVTTQERVPVIDDVTGENAIFLGQVDIR